MLYNDTSCPQTLDSKKNAEFMKHGFVKPTKTDVLILDSDCKKFEANFSGNESFMKIREKTCLVLLNLCVSADCPHTNSICVRDVNCWSFVLLVTRPGCCSAVTHSFFTFSWCSVKCNKQGLLLLLLLTVATVQRDVVHVCLSLGEQKP